MMSHDAGLLSEVKEALLPFGVSLDLRQDATSALELISRRHLDGIFLDCDDVVGGPDTVGRVRSSSSNKETVTIAVVNGVTGVETALRLGANFVLGKPIQETRLRSLLEIAVPKMEREHRRYFRYEVDLPARLSGAHGQRFTAHIKNVSEGGLSLRMAVPLRIEGVVRMEFDFPSIEPQVFHAKAEVVWSGSFDLGLRFLYVDSQSGTAFRSWLQVLEAQSQVRECGA